MRETPDSDTHCAPRMLPTALAVPRTPITPTPNTNMAPADAKTKPPVVIATQSVTGSTQGTPRQAALTRGSHKAQFLGLRLATWLACGQ